MKVLSLDVSSVSTGWALINEDAKLLHFGTISIPNLDVMAKLYWFHNYLESLIFTLEPDIILVEETYLKNVKTLKTLSQFIGMVNFLVFKHHKPAVYLNPNAVRAFFKLRTKADVFDFVKNKYKSKLKELTFNNGNDITDAILQALYYIENN